MSKESGSANCAICAHARVKPWRDGGLLVGRSTKSVVRCAKSCWCYGDGSEKTYTLRYITGTGMSASQARKSASRFAAIAERCPFYQEACVEGELAMFVAAMLYKPE